MFLHRFLLFLAALALGHCSTASDTTTAAPLTKYIIRKSLKDISASAKLLMAYIPTDNWKTMLEMVFDAPERLRFVIGYELTASLLEANAICEGIAMEEISVRASALFSLWIQAEFGLWMEDTVFVDLFLKACDQSNKLLFELHKIFEILSMESNPLVTAIAADRFHKYQTIDQARMRIVRTASILAFVEANRVRYTNDTKQREIEEALLEIIAQIGVRLDHIISDSQGETVYFKNKIPGMIKPIFDNLISQKDQIKAEALMTALSEIHTTDRFVVIVYDENCRLGTIINAVEKNYIIKEEYKTIVYRSQNAFKMTEHVENTTLNVLKFRSDKKPFSCSKLGAFNITKATTNSGLVLIEKCPMVIVQDKRSAGAQRDVSHHFGNTD